jgi:hypothetical protein
MVFTRCGVCEPLLPELAAGAVRVLREPERGLLALLPAPETAVFGC